MPSPSVKTVRIITEQGLNALAQGGVLRQAELRIGPQQGLGLVLGCLHDLRIRAEIRHVHLRQTVLARAEEIAGAAQAQVFFGDLKAVVGFS